MLDEITPTVDDVAALLYARTRDRYDKTVGTFNADTSPTATQVESLIGRSAQVVSLELGRPHSVMGSLTDQARAVVALRAAWQIEVSYFPQQLDSGDSAASQLRDMYEADLALLGVAARDNQAGGRRARTMHVGL